MLDPPPREPPWRSWLWVALGAGAIYATVPLARRIAEAVESLASGELFRLGVYVLVVAAAGATLRALARTRRLRPGALGWVLATAAAYALGAATLCERPEEAVHFVEYGGLSVLAYRALSHSVRDGGVYLAAAGVSAALGVVDEAVQWLTPERIWDLGDIGINTLGAVLPLPALAFGLRPPGIRARPAARGVRAAALAWAVAWGLLGLSLLVTPPRIARLAGLPGVGAAAARGDLMLEYGHRIEHPEIGSFRSRFSAETLRRLDRERAEEAAAVLAREGAEDGYAAFLRRYNPITDPFLHELRVHLFRRDRYRATAENHPDDLRWYRSDLTVAWRENRILELFFGESLARAGLRWPEPERAYVASQQRARKPYVSKVSDDLVTALGEREVAGVWALGLLLLLGTAAAAGRGRPPDQPASVLRSPAMPPR